MKYEFMCEDERNVNRKNSFINQKYQEIRVYLEESKFKLDY